MKFSEVCWPRHDMSHGELTPITSWYPIKRLIVWYRKASKAREQCCRGACQILERSYSSRYKPRVSETLRDLTIKCLLGYWNKALIFDDQIWLIWTQFMRHITSIYRMTWWILQRLTWNTSNLNIFPSQHNIGGCVYSLPRMIGEICRSLLWSLPN